jgi:hypothetical protein
MSACTRCPASPIAVGGPGADTIDLLTPISNWVENAARPKELIASKLNAAGAVTFTRPLCPFPQWPKYTGGNSSSVSSFTCARPDNDDRRVGWDR